MDNRFFFMPPASLNQTQREIELDQAARKAHTAKINHVQRKRKLKLIRATTGSNSSSSDQDKTQSDNQPRENSISGSKAVANLIRSEATDYNFNNFLRARSGNSDPFSCQAIPVTPRTNQVISFFRFYSARSWSTSFMLQLVRLNAGDSPKPGHDNPVGLAASHSLWKLLLRYQIGFWPVVSSLIPLMRRLMSEDIGEELVRLGLQMRAQNLKSLRESLKNFEHMTSPPITLVYHVKGLFREACMNGEPESAKVHAKMLCGFSEKCAEEGSDIQSLRIGLWSDASSALMQWRRPIFDAVDWMPQTLHTIWRLADLVLPPFQDDELDVLPQMFSPVLREAFLHVRQALRVCQSPIVPRNDNDVQRAEVIFHWANTKAEHHMCCLLNLYFDLIEEKSICSMSEGRRFTEASLAVALLHILQKSFSDATQADGVDIHESAGVLYPILKTSVERALKECLEAEIESFQAAHFWTLYVGAYCEERLRISDLRTIDAYESRRLPQTWFQKELTKKAICMGVLRWEDAQPILLQFAFVDYLNPHPKTWYEQMINISQTGFLL